MKKTQWMCCAQERKDDPLDADVPSEKKRREYFMKKHISKLFVAVLLVLSVAFILPGKVSAAITGSGSGTGSDPHVLTIDHCENETFVYTVSTQADPKLGYCSYVTLNMASAGRLTVTNKGDYTIYYSTDGGTTWTNSFKVNAVTMKKDAVMNLKIRGNSGSTGELYITSVKLGESLEEWNSPQTALDISNGYDGTTTSFEGISKQTVWYKFTIAKEAVATIFLPGNNYYVELLDPNGNKILEDMFHRYDTGDGNSDGSYTKTVYTPGTYYLSVINYVGKYIGDLKFSMRDYVPITQLNFEHGTNYTVTWSKYGPTGYVQNNYTVPAGVDGTIARTTHDASFFSKVLYSFAGTEQTVFDVGTIKKFGTTTIRYYDERGKEVASYTVNIVPPPVGGAEFIGSTRSIDIKVNQGDGWAADYIRVYQEKSGKWVLINSVPVKNLGSLSNVKPIKISKLSANKNYKFRLAYYDDESKVEGKATTFTAGTAVKTRPAIKSIGKTKITKRRAYSTHNPGKITEWREYYDLYTATAKIAVKKVKGANGYDFNTGTYLKKTSGTVTLASARVKKTNLSRTQSVKVRTVRVISSYAKAYGPWSLTKKVRIR